MSANINIMPRRGWLAKTPKWKDYVLTGNPLPNVVVKQMLCRGCYNFNQCIDHLCEIQETHMKYKNVPDIIYNFLISGDGTVYMGRGFGVQPTLPERLQRINNSSLFIGILGGGVRRHPIERNTTLRSMYGLIRYGVRKSLISPRFLQYHIS